MNLSPSHGIRRLICRIFGTVTVIAFVALRCEAQTPPGPPSDPATAYVEGMEALEAGGFPLAVTDLTRALAGDADNADYLRARGVANTLAENFSAAIADLERALRLHADDFEAKLWVAAAYRMKGDPATGANYFSTRGVPPNYANLVYNEMAMDYWSSRTNGSSW